MIPCLHNCSSCLWLHTQHLNGEDKYWCTLYCRDIPVDLPDPHDFPDFICSVGELISVLPATKYIPNQAIEHEYYIDPVEIESVRVARDEGRNKMLITTRSGQNYWVDALEEDLDSAVDDVWEFARFAKIARIGFGKRRGGQA